MNSLLAIVSFVKNKPITFFIKIQNTMSLFRSKVDYEKDVTFNGTVYISSLGYLKIGHNCTVNSGKSHTPIGGDTVTRLIVKKGAKLEIGNNVGISNSTIYCTVGISIQDNVLIGGGTKIWDTDFHSLDPIARVFKGDTEIKSRPITIESSVFIGGSSIILKGVTIGKNSIVGAGSVVTKSIPSNEIWAGNPAKFIRKIGEAIK